MKPTAVEMEERARQLRDWALSRKRHVEADERFGYPPAHVDVNAVLALIQVEMKAEHRAMTVIINMLDGKVWNGKTWNGKGT